MPGVRRVCLQIFQRYICISGQLCSRSAHCALVPQTFTLIVYKYFGLDKAKTPVGHMPGKWASELTSNPDLSSNRYISYNANAVTIRNCLALFSSELWALGVAGLSSVPADLSMLITVKNPNCFCSFQGIPYRVARRVCVRSLRLHCSHRQCFDRIAKTKI